MSNEKSPEESRKEILTELVGISGKLQSLSFPTLSRPVGFQKPATLDLVVWASRMYCYSVLAALKEMLESFISLVNDGRIPASHLIARFMFELAGHTCFVKEEVARRLKKEEYQQAWDQLAKVNMGSSGLRRIQNEGSLLPPDPYGVGTFMARLFKWSEKEGRPVKVLYDNLSERSHPTYLAFSAFYKMSGETELVFRKPQRKETHALLPDTWMAVTLTLLFVQELLVEVQDTDGALELKQLLTGESK